VNVGGDTGSSCSLPPGYRHVRSPYPCHAFHLPARPTQRPAVRAAPTQRPSRSSTFDAESKVAARLFRGKTVDKLQEAQRAACRTEIGGQRQARKQQRDQLAAYSNGVAARMFSGTIGREQAAQFAAHRYSQQERH